ncbi:MAG: chemotaxis protein CheW, partial [Halothiobacillaceae bacterium]|jgi:purine-binding chemotaxis protein CheW|nr:chemotaxis protein CheW [Halothiobacillaceae bacterium]
VVVDAVNEVLDIDAAQIEPPPSFGAGIRSEFIRGMGKIDGQFVIILDVNRVLSVEEMSQVAQLGESAPAALPAGA